VSTSLEQDVDFYLVDGPGFTPEEAYALLAGIGDASTSPLIAAANAGHTGAMIALVPSDADAKRLKVPNGEARDQLHLTLLYLGEADAISEADQAKIIDGVMRLANATSPISAQGFSINVFNPAGDEPCLVLGVGNGGPELEDVHRSVNSIVRGIGVAHPENHMPWVPHVTLAYTDDLSQVAKLAKKTGPVTFDHIRVAFAGDVTDIPLSVPLAAAFWKSSEHPRGNDGQFIDKNAIDMAGFEGRVATAARTPDAIRKATPLEYGGIGVARSAPPDTRFAGAVDTYMSGAFEDINGGLRRGRGDVGKVTGQSGAGATSVRGTATVRDALTKLDQAMAESKLRDDVVVTRGIVNPQHVFGKLWSDDVTGLSWREFGFSSTSPDREYARSYAGQENGVVMNVLVPRGTGGIYVQENLGGGDTVHHELVLDRGLRYRVVRDRGMVNGIRTIDVEVS
jgi:2'-5' RNA ligase